MDAERWQKVDRVFHAALQAEPSRRAALLEDSCAGDESLRREVESLLAHYESAESFIERPAFATGQLLSSPQSSSSAAESLAPGSTVAQYRLLQAIGAGGMGEVWRAEQAEPIRRTVALKLIKAGMDTRAVVARFDSERQALALMDHPNIAKVFDAGATAAGRPYFAMEYVPGIPITEYCDQHRLTIRERLLLFIRVCDGVLHAHQKAVIHRDLKPSNILVVEVDGSPVPKIIDFGLAKATAGHLTDHSMFTELGVIVGTPAYMSPEQAGSQDGNIDTRTDVYSLGVILFELLVGALPIAPQDLRQGGVEATLRRIRESEPPRPSAKLSAMGPSSNSALHRKEEPASLIRRVRGDLDWITIRAMEKDRARRYGSVSELATDIRRHLEDQPVLAGPPEATYRAGKFVRRHRIGVTVAAVIAVLVIGFVAASGVQARRIVRERDRASREAAAAKSVSDFLISLFNVSNPSQAQGNTITARELLDRGRAQMERSLSGQPEIQARMMDTMGQVYLSLGLYAQARDVLEKALEKRRKLLGPEHPDTLATSDHLARSLEREGHYVEAEKLIRYALDIRMRRLGPEHLDTLASRHAVIVIAIDKGDYVEAEKLGREELEVLRRVRGPEHPDTLASMHDLALDLANLGRPAEASTLFRQTIDIQRRTLGDSHPDTLITMTALGLSLANEGKYEEAEKILRATVDAERRVLGDEHSETLWAMHDLSITLREGGHPAEAEALERQTLAARRRVLGPEHSETLTSMNNLAADLDDLHRFAEAERLYRETIQIQARVLGPGHPETAVTKYNLACNLALSGRPGAALAVLRDAVDHGLSPDAALAIERDSDLKSLHNAPGFSALLTHIRKRAAESANL